MRTHGGDINIFDNELRQRTGFTGGVNIDGRNAPLRIKTAAQRAAAVDNRDADFLRRRFAFLETVHRFPAGQFNQAVNDVRTGTGGHIKNLLAFLDIQQQRAAPAAITFDNADNLAHDVLL